MTKALVCAKCLDIRALDDDGAWVTCRCGNSSARWEDPQAGKVRCKSARDGTPYQEVDRRHIRILGMNNRYLLPALRGPDHEQMVEAGGQWEWWRALADAATNAKGYIFDKACRNTWATIVKVNETADIKWEEP